MDTNVWFRMVVTTFVLVGGGAGISTAQEQPRGVREDTVYYLSPVIVNPTEALERKSPVTFTNITAKQLTDRYSNQDVPVLLSELPSMTFYSENGNGIGYNYINLRGFDQRRLSVMINGVPQNDPEDHNVYWIDFPDLVASVGTIQVQRGAGSAFYGPPAIGGSVNLATDPFSRRPGITVESMFGFQEFGDSTTHLPLTTRRYQTTVNTGLINGRYMLYGKLGKILSDGYRTNSWVDMNSFFLGGILLDSTMSTRFHIFGGPITDGLSYTGLPSFANSDKKLRRQNLAYWETDSTQTAYSTVAARRPQESESFTQPHIELIHEWRPSQILSVHNTLFYYSGDGYYDYDASWADTSMLHLGTRYGIPATQNPVNTLVRAFVGNRQWGWLPRVDISHAQGTLTLGAELRLHRSTHWGKISFADGLPPTMDPDYHFYEYNGVRNIISFYGHELYRPQEDLTIMADLQIVRNTYGIENEKYLGYSFTVPYTFANPRIGVNYNITEEWNSYVSLAYTSREPTMRNLYAAEDSYFGATPQFKADTAGGVVSYNFDEPLAKPEQLLDAEAGVGYRAAEAEITANVFWMEFTNELVKSGQVDIFGQPVTGNAERTRHLGFELAGRITTPEGITLSGNLSISHNRLVHYRVVQDGEYVTLDDNPIAGFPDILANLRATYRTGDLSASLIEKYVGPFYTDNFKNDLNKNPEYTVLNCEVLYRLPRAVASSLTLRAEARNLLNRLYTTSGEGDSFFPAAERNYVLGFTLSL